MGTHPKKVMLPPDSELGFLLKDAAQSDDSIVIDTGEALYTLSVHLVDSASRLPQAEEIARSREGILKATGRWRGIVDAEHFKSYIYERRRASSRPPVRL